MKLALTRIIVDPALQARAGGVDEAVAREYGEVPRTAHALGKPGLPAVVVFGPCPEIVPIIEHPNIENIPLASPAFDGVTRYRQENYWLADGFHRVRGAELAGLEEIECEVRAGGRREALLYAVGANAAHGVRRSQADKRKAVLTLLGDAEWAARSDRWIAEAARVDHKTVTALRKSQTTSGGEFPTSAERTGKDGKVYTPSAAQPIEDSAVLPGTGQSEQGAGEGKVASPPRAGGAAAEKLKVENGKRRDVVGSFQAKLAALLAEVPEENRHFLCGQLRNAADDHDPEFQEEQRLVELERQEKLFAAKVTKRRGK